MRCETAPAVDKDEEYREKIRALEQQSIADREAGYKALEQKVQEMMSRLDIQNANLYKQELK